MEPLLIRHAEAQRLLGLGTSQYFKMIREGRIQSVGKGKMSRAVYSSIKEYVQALVTEAQSAERKPSPHIVAMSAARHGRR
jgi:hypothetical protein